MDNLWQLYDDKTDRVVFVGSDKECEEYTKEYPDTKFYMIELKEAKKTKNICDII